MRKLISKSENEKKSRRNQIILGIILVIIMFFSVIGYSFLGNEEETSSKIIYNEFEFINSNGFFLLKIEDFNFAFQTNPNEFEVQNISSDLKYLNNYYNKPLYLNFENYEVGAQIYRNLDPQYNNIVQRIQLACLNEEECKDENFPIKTCENNFIIIKESNFTSIIQDNNCVYISGSKEDLIKVTDEFLYKILGVK